MKRNAFKLNEIVYSNIYIFNIISEGFTVATYWLIILLLTIFIFPCQIAIND